VLTCIQILSQAKPMEEISTKPIKKAINQPIIEDQTNLGV
jgi:hypothetical protein